jgi:lysylphosphatidylglycerol synthetase-like protein (DUF2156 family)
MIAISLLAAIAAVRVRRAASARVLPAGAAAIAGAAYIAIVVAASVAMPAVQEVPRAFPATTLWQFRQASVGMNAVLWATIGLVFAAAVPRVMIQPHDREQPQHPQPHHDPVRVRLDRRRGGRGD